MNINIDPRDRWLVQQFGAEGALFATTQGCMHLEIAAQLKSEPSSKAPKAKDADNPADSKAAA